MHENLEFELRRLADRRDLLERHLPLEHDPGYAELFRDFESG